MAIKKFTKKEVEKMDDLTDYERVDKMSEDEIQKNAESDLDVPLQSEEDLKRFKQVKNPESNRMKKSKTSTKYTPKVLTKHCSGQAAECNDRYTRRAYK